MADLEFTGIGIHVKVADIEASRRFYDSLGMKVVFGYGDDEFRASLPEGCDSAPEQYRGLTYQLTEDINYEIAEGHIAVKQETFQEVITSAKISAMIRVESLVPLLENRAVHIKFPVRRYYWGTIEAALRDPDGFVLIFVAPDSDEEYDTVSELTEVETISPAG